MATASKIIDKIAQTIRSHDLIREGDTVLAAVSGGPDSVCMLHALCGLREEMRINVAAAHMNHMLRGEDADRDAEYVSELCGRLGVVLYHASADIAAVARERKVSLETAGRDERYRFLRETAAEAGAACIAVAHNSGDQVETIMMNIIRGTGPEGLAGMAYRNGSVVRPVLDLSRAEIEEYCRENMLEPRIDRTNFETEYTRNKLRNEILPMIDTIPGADINKAVLRLSGLAAAENRYMRERAAEAYEMCARTDTGDDGDGVIRLDATALCALHEAVARRVLRLALDKLCGGTTDIEAHHVARMLEAAAKWRTGATLELTGGVVLVKSYGEVIIRRAGQAGADAGGGAPEEPEARAVFESGNAELGPLTVRAEIFSAGEAAEMPAKPEAAALTQYFDYEKVGPECVLRTRRPGDVFKPLGAPGHKKLNDWFIDRKIPRDVRDKIFLLSKNNEIIWIIGYNINENFKAAGATRRILKLEADTGRKGWLHV